jgi:hypothetical protein
MKQALKLADYEEVSQLMREMGFVYLTFAEGLHALDAEYITHGGNYRTRIKDREQDMYHRFSGFVTMKLTNTVNKMRLQLFDVIEEILQFSSKFFENDPNLNGKMSQYKKSVKNALDKIDSKYDGILSMPSGHQKENSDYIFEKFCEGLQVAGFDNGKDKSKSQNALLLNPFHDNDEANFSMLEKEEQGGVQTPTHEEFKFKKMLWFNKMNERGIPKGHRSDRARKSEEMFMEEMSFSSEIIDFWNNKPMNRNRKRIVCDFLDDAPDNIFFSEVSTDPTARYTANLGDDNTNLCHSVGDLYNFLNPDLSTEGKVIETHKSGEDILEMIKKKTFTTHSSFGDKLNVEVEEVEKKGQEFEKLGESPTEGDEEIRKMNDGFVMSQSNEILESLDTKEFVAEDGAKKQSKLLCTPEKSGTLGSTQLVPTLGSFMKGITDI